jgi:hypothetical protein
MIKDSNHTFHPSTIHHQTMNCITSLPVRHHTVIYFLTACRSFNHHNRYFCQ